MYASAVVLQNWPHPLARPAKCKHRLGFIASQGEIKDVKVLSHVSAVGCASERQHAELDSEAKYYLRNRLASAWWHLERSESSAAGRSRGYPARTKTGVGCWRFVRSLERLSLTSNRSTI